MRIVISIRLLNRHAQTATLEASKKKHKLATAKNMHLAIKFSRMGSTSAIEKNHLLKL